MNANSFVEWAQLILTSQLCCSISSFWNLRADEHPAYNEERVCASAAIKRADIQLFRHMLFGSIVKSV